MRHIITACALSFCMVTTAWAQTQPTPEQAQITGSSEGTVACKTEAAMVTLMKADLPNGMTNEKVLDQLVKSGDCVIMPRGWLLLEAKDPPLKEQGDHASQWTIRTPQGIVHMWGSPVGEE